MTLTDGEIRTLLRSGGIHIAENVRDATKETLIKTLRRMLELAEALPESSK